MNSKSIYHYMDLWRYKHIIWISSDSTKIVFHGAPNHHNHFMIQGWNREGPKSALLHFLWIDISHWVIYMDRGISPRSIIFTFYKPITTLVRGHLCCTHVNSLPLVINNPIYENLQLITLESSLSFFYLLPWELRAQGLA